ncbi:acyl-CoA dehydrogenase family protein [Aquabacterium sp.]|uniref:acyl-CoA dehydrogenase family protein n=1 Tax=Aquabacterium sp. TaxID=1872578 RepID=UPI0035B2DAEF
MTQSNPSAGGAGGLPGLAGWSAGLAAVAELPRSARRDVEAAIELARRFNAEVVRLLALDLDRAVQDDPELLAHGFIAQANEWRLFTRWLPKMFGGAGWNMLSLYAFIEEVSSECVGLANVIGVHYLGVATLLSTWNMRLALRVFADVVAGERARRPCLVSLAITEPHAGTDVEETELVDRARLGTTATRQPDGSYRLDGRKVFISNGHVSTWHMVISYEDRRHPADTTVVAAVRTGTPGFSFGAKEKKMGQKACVASELLFDDCRVPPEQVALDREQTRALGRPHRDIAQTVIDYVVSSTRAGVGAFAAGTARGAAEAATRYAATRQLAGGQLLIEQQWAQTLLADMAQHAAQARQAYIESALANGLGGLYQVLFAQPAYGADRLMPRAWMRRGGALALRSDWLTRWFQRRYLGAYPPCWQHLTSGVASLAKVACSDFAVKNAGLAIELMGADGLRHEYGVEKRLRDAKLLQIYEGTNQLNRINYFKCLLRPHEGVRVFLRNCAV